MYFYTLTYLTFPTSPPSKVNISSISLKKSFLLFSPLKISLNILPSFKNKIRSQKDALNGSCVTIKIVACIFLLISDIVSSNNLEAFESKAPVGTALLVQSIYCGYPHSYPLYVDKIKARRRIVRLASLLFTPKLSTLFFDVFNQLRIAADEISIKCLVHRLSVHFHHMCDNLFCECCCTSDSVIAP